LVYGKQDNIYFHARQHVGEFHQVIIVAPLPSHEDLKTVANPGIVYSYEDSGRDAWKR